MRNVGLVGYGGVRYGYVYQPKNNRQLKRKIAKLELLGCTNIVCDIGSRTNLDELLKDARFQDHILFYDQLVFQCMDEYSAIVRQSIGDYDADPGFDFDVYDRQYHIGHDVEATNWLRKRFARRDRLKKMIQPFRQLIHLFRRFPNTGKAWR